MLTIVWLLTIIWLKPKPRAFDARGQPPPGIVPLWTPPLVLVAFGEAASVAFSEAALAKSDDEALASFDDEASVAFCSIVTSQLSVASTRTFVRSYGKVSSSPRGWCNFVFLAPSALAGWSRASPLPLLSISNSVSLDIACGPTAQRASPVRMGKSQQGFRTLAGKPTAGFARSYGISLGETLFVQWGILRQGFTCP